MIRDQKVGDKIWFKNEKRPYTIQACNRRFIICTKPYNPKKTVLYCIIDLDQNIRGTENLIFCAGFETREECEESLKRLESQSSQVSFRNRVELDIIKIKKVL